MLKHQSRIKSIISAFAGVLLATSTVSVAPSAFAVTEPLLMTFVVPDNAEITIPMLYGTAPNAVIDWGDGTATTSATSLTRYTHTYASAGSYQVTIDGPVSVIGEDSIFVSHFKYLKSLDAWGTELQSGALLFGTAYNLASVPATLPTRFTDLSLMFYKATVPAAVSSWDVSNVTIAAGMFARAILTTDLKDWQFKALDHAYGVAGSSNPNFYDLASLVDSFTSWTIEDYSDTLVGWASAVNDLPSGVLMSGLPSPLGHCSYADSAYATLTANPGKNWTIVDGGSIACTPKAYFFPNGATFPDGSTITGFNTQSSATSTTLTSKPVTWVKTGYNFAGWNTKADGTGTSYANGATYSFASSVKLFAQWVQPGVLNWTDQTVATPVAGVAFNDGVAAPGTTTYSVSAGSLPAGLSLNSSTGAITGTPTSGGAYSFTITATGNGTSISKAFSGTVTGPAWTDQTLGTMTVGTSYTDGVAASGVSGSPSYAVTSGTLPAGLSLDGSTGAITGQPTTAGAYSFTITAYGASSSLITKAFSGSVQSAGGGDTTAPTITGSGSVSVTAPSTTVATYSANESVTWTISGTNSALFQINSSGVVTFINASTVGVYTLVVTATDGASNARNKNVTVTVTDGSGGNNGGGNEDPAPSGPTVTVPSSPSVPAGSTTVATLTADRTVTWTITGGANAALFTIVDGQLRFRTEPTAGTYTVEVTATDASGNTTRQTITVTVLPGPTVTVTTDPSGNPIIGATDPSGGSTTAQVVSTDRNGVTATVQNGRVVVTDPTFSGRLNVVVSVTGSNGAVTRTTVQLTVLPQPATALESRPAAASNPTRTNALFAPSTVITWAASPNAQSYRVLISGTEVGTTTETQYTVNRLLPRGTKVEIIPLGGDSTVGPAIDLSVSGGTFVVGNSGFSTDSSVLTAAAKRFLNQVANAIKSNKVKAAVIEGHTDNVGSASRNQALALARADAVRDYLQALVGSKVKITIVAKGAAEPVESNSTEAGRAANRRVEVKLKY